MTLLPFAYFQGGIVPIEEANISIASNSLQYGTSCFGGIRGYVVGGKVRLFRLVDHHERLMKASDMLGLSYSLSYEEFLKIIAALVAKNQPQEDFYIRPFIFSQTRRLGPKPEGLQFELAIYMLTLSHYFSQGRGMRLMVSSWRKFPDIAMPTKAKAGGCYVNSFMATGEALRCGYDEALLTDNEGSIVEASVANILISYHGRLLTPPLGAALLEGITLRTMIDLLHSEGYTVAFEKLDRSLIYGCDELLLLGTAVQVAYALSVDDRPIGKPASQPGPFYQLLSQRFNELVRGETIKKSDWIVELDLDAVNEVDRVDGVDEVNEVD